MWFACREPAVPLYLPPAVWIGERNVAAEELARQVANDIAWLAGLVADIQRDLEVRQDLLGEQLIYNHQSLDL